MTKRIPSKILLFAVFFCIIQSAYSQLGMQIILNRKVYMQYEPVYACVSLRNNTGRTLIFGQDAKLQGFIYFLIVDSNGKTAAKIPGKEISTTGLVLKPGEVRNIVLPVNEYYNLDNPGTYSINVCVAHNMLAKEYKCRINRNFQIDKGVEIWHAKVGIPDLHGKNVNSKEKFRRYSIRLLTEHPHKHYYLFVEDEKMVYGVSRLGKKTGIEKIKAETDMLGRIHLLIPMSSKVFHYLTFSLDGTNTNSSYWKTTNTIPTIYRDRKSGFVRRVGGVEAQKGIDYITSPTAVSASRLMSEGAAIAEGMINFNNDSLSTSGKDDD